MRRALLIVVAVGFALGLSYPYLGLDPGDSRIEVPGGLRYAVLVTHIFTAAVALVLGPLQFLTRGRTTHRTLGRVYLLAGVLPAAVATVPVALWSGRLLTQVGLISAAVLWLVTGGLAYRAARRRDFAAHRAWMLRNYALTFLAVTARVLVPVLLLVQIPFGGADPARVPELIPIGQTLGWIVNLALVELFIVRRTGRSHTTPPPLPPPP
ncbi:DUF2306 domain-containing protein [Dactylosporangium sp. McL0621]|uniref:DUF2306 domain-containing protein n=1 Tax=Dactylosporangium sp. McL0621 TaxID=3415678 RepID=UPI003CF995DC